MEEKKIKFSNIIYLIIAIIVVLMLILGQREQVKVEEISISAEESAGSGLLEIETIPSDAEIFMDDIYKGKSPINLYNVPAGLYNIVVKKEGYEDLAKDVNIEAGKKTSIEARLVLLQAVEEAEITEVVEEIEEVEEEKEETLTEDLKANGQINIGKGIVFYYDFSEGKFSDTRMLDSDVFSRRFPSHLVFTRFNPANIKTIDKGIENVEKADCTGIKGQFEYLRSGQSLCVITLENEIAAIGGSWENTEDINLTWKLFS